MTDNIVFPDSFGTRMALFVDTEEEFDWGDTLSRHDHGVSAVPALREGQAMFESAGLSPCYLVDTPILDSDEAIEILGVMLAAGTASVGAHLHPWVTPPFDEDVSPVNSYAGNLPEAMERQKIRYVRTLITERLGKAPKAYRAGRYGIGPNSFRILAEEGFVCDTSVRSMFDYSSDGGPDFRGKSLHPSRVGPNGTIVELPLTTVLIGYLGGRGRRLYGWGEHVPGIRSVLSRTQLAQRIPLTPEGIPADKACAAIDVALAMGVRLLNFSFHSPSLAIGHTPYVRDAADLKAFYQWWDTIFAHCHKHGVAPASLDEILAAAASPASA
jgi:hypothetical protein